MRFTEFQPDLVFLLNPLESVNFRPETSDLRRSLQQDLR